MISRQLEIDLDDAMPGMTLSDDIPDGHGGMLLPRGSIVTEANLVSLRRRGIDRIFIVSDQISAADLAAERDRLRQRLEHLFRKCRNQGASESLLKSVTQYRIGELE